MIQCTNIGTFLVLASIFDNEYLTDFCWVRIVDTLHRLFLVNFYLLFVPMLPSQPASNVGGSVIQFNCLELA